MDRKLSNKNKIIVAAIQLREKMKEVSRKVDELSSLNSDTLWNNDLEKQRLAEAKDVLANILEKICRVRCEVERSSTLIKQGAYMAGFTGIILILISGFNLSVQVAILMRWCTLWFAIDIN